MASLKERKHCYRTSWHRDNLAGQPHESLLQVNYFSKQTVWSFWIAIQYLCWWVWCFYVWETWASFGTDHIVCWLIIFFVMFQKDALGRWGFGYYSTHTHMVQWWIYCWFVWCLESGYCDLRVLVLWCEIHYKITCSYANS